MAERGVQSALDRIEGPRLLGRYTVMAVVAVLILFPIYVTVIFALKPGTAIFNYPRALLPVDLTLDTLKEAWNTGHLDRYLFNSAVVSIAITVGQLVTSVLAAYAFAFMRFPLKNVLFFVVLATLLVPAEVTVLANFDTIKTLGWTDTYQGLVVPFVAAAFGIVPAAPGLPHRAEGPPGGRSARRRRPPRLPPRGGGAARPAHARRPRPCSRSSARGTSTCGRSASPTTPTTAPSRSA